MSSAKRVLALVVLLLALPAMLVLGTVTAFYAHNRSNGSIVSSGDKREYLLYVPKSYDPTRPAPLVISMHGAGGWPVQQMEISGWNRVADREGFLVVYPSGKVGAGPRVWHMGGAKDVRFIADLIDRLEASYNIDPSRIYANGVSNGGGMAFVLSCTMSDRIAAVGTVAAAQLLPWKWCRDRTPVPMIAFHGTSDPMAPYAGGSTWVAEERFPDVRTWTANWARRNRCAPNAIDSEVAVDVTRHEYTRCAENASVILYTIRGGGHTWPGGQPLPEWFAGRTTRSIDASSEMWAFFRSHPLFRSRVDGGREK